MSVESASACKVQPESDVEQAKSSTMMSALGNQQREHLLRQLDRLKQDLNEKFMQDPRPSGTSAKEESGFLRSFSILGSHDEEQGASQPDAIRT